MNYYGMNLNEKEKEYQDYKQKATLENKEKAVGVTVCPECGSPLHDDGKYCICTNMECNYKSEKPKEKDFWEYDPNVQINIDGVGKPRTNNDISLDSKQYNLAIAGLMFYGFFINALECIFLRSFALSLSPLLFLIGYFFCAFKGISICMTADDLRKKFLGYNMVVLPIGILLTRYIDNFDSYLVFNACCLTAGFTLTMMMLAYYFPKVFANMGEGLLVSLFLIIVADIAIIFGFGIVDPYAIDIFASFVFCAFIGYDMVRAQRKECTAYNAIEVALNMYLDIINLFMRILAILDKKKN